MKRVTFALLLCFVISLPVWSDISIDWDAIYSAYPITQVYDFVALGNGEFLCFYVYSNQGSRVHVVRVNIDGELLDHYDFDDPIAAPTNVRACESPDGGAYLVQGLSDELLISRFNSNGILVGNHRIDRLWMTWCGDIDCTLDRIILGGNQHNVVALSPDGTILYANDFGSGPGNLIHIRYLLQLQGGLFLGTGTSESQYAWFEAYHATFSPNGTLYGESTDNPLWLSQFNVALSPFQDDPVYEYTDERYPTFARAKKIDGWTQTLPNDVNAVGSWNDMDAFLGDTGYLTVGYLSNLHAGCIVELAESDGEMDTLLIEDRQFYQSVAAFDGSMLVAGREYDPHTYRYVLALSRVVPAETHLPVQAKLWISNAPRVLPANGGTIRYHVMIQNDLDNPTDIMFRLSLVPPNTPSQVIYEGSSMLNPNQQISLANRPLVIGATQPAGEYSLVLEAFDGDGNLLSHYHKCFFKSGSPGLSDVAESEMVAAEYALAGVYPNPFNATTTICLTLPQAAELSVRVFDIQGRTVATLADGSSTAAGSHSFSFDGSNLSSGIYFVQATVPGQLSELRKLVLVK